MTASMRKKLHASALSCLMAFLFLGGLALAGSDFAGWPWGQLIGVPMLGLFAFIGRHLENRRGRVLPGPAPACFFYKEHTSIPRPSGTGKVAGFLPPFSPCEPAHVALGKVRPEPAEANPGNNHLTTNQGDKL